MESGERRKARDRERGSGDNYLIREAFNEGKQCLVIRDKWPNRHSCSVVITIIIIINSGMDALEQ